MICKWLYIIERFHSRDQHLCKFMGTKESVYIRKEINSHRIGLEHQHGRRFIGLDWPRWRHVKTLYRKLWHALSHSLHFVRHEGRLATHPPSPASKSGSRLPIRVFNSVCLGPVPGEIDSPYLIIMSWITIPRDEYYTIHEETTLVSKSP